MLASIIFAGEIVFSLPFHIARFFRPQFLEVFALSNTQLGDIFAAYGLVAMLAYFPGGLIADRFAPRKLMAFSLLATALGGIYLYSIPGASGLKLLFAYWGVTSILLFWGAMIKVTRQWGAASKQGLAFGLLDGGRGFVASLFASVAVLILSISVGGQTDSSSQGLQQVILFYVLVTVIAAAAIWFALPNIESGADVQEEVTDKHLHIGEVLKNLNVWLQGGIVVAAYCGYKALDNYGIYAVEVLSMSQLDSSEFTTLASYSRPLAAIAAGLIVDRFGGSRVIKLLFIVLAGAFLVLAVFNPTASGSGKFLWFVMANLLITFVAVYALRGVYFALLEESKIKLHSTGTAVGVISFLGFTPDIFFAPITGRILDANPGFVGFQYYFSTMAFIAFIGLILAAILIKRLSVPPAIPPAILPKT